MEWKVCHCTGILIGISGVFGSGNSPVLISKQTHLIVSGTDWQVDDFARSFVKVQMLLGHPESECGSLFRGFAHFWFSLNRGSITGRGHFFQQPGVASQPGGWPRTVQRSIQDFPGQQC